MSQVYFGNKITQVNTMTYKEIDLFNSRILLAITADINIISDSSDQ